MSKIYFEPENKLIVVNTGVTTIDVQKDLYSTWKDWSLSGDNSKWAAAFSAFGGDPIGNNQYSPRFFFLTNNWKVKVNDNTTGITFQMNLYSDDQKSPFIINNSAVLNKTSDIPVIEVTSGGGTNEISDYNGKIYVDAINGFTGSTYPVGTVYRPVKFSYDLINISNNRNIRDFYYISTFNTSGITQNFVGYNNYAYVKGIEFIIEEITVVENCRFFDFNFNNCDFNKRYNVLDNCHINEAYNFKGDIKNSYLKGIINIVENTNIINCCPYDDVPIINLSSGVTCNIRNWSGDIIINSTNNSTILILEINAGNVTINSGCTSGIINIKGISGVFDNSSGCTVIDQTLNRQSIENSTWDAPIAQHLEVGSTGNALYNVSAGATPEVIAEAVWSMVITGITTEGSAANTLTYIVELNTGSTVAINTMSEDIKRILGLTQENFRIKDQVYDTNDLLQSATIRIYNNSSDCDGDINPLAEYSMTALYDSEGRLTNYKVIKN